MVIRFGGKPPCYFPRSCWLDGVDPQPESPQGCRCGQEVALGWRKALVRALAANLLPAPAGPRARRRPTSTTRWAQLWAPSFMNRFLLLLVRTGISHYLTAQGPWVGVEHRGGQGIQADADRRGRTGGSEGKGTLGEGVWLCPNH